MNTPHPTTPLPSPDSDVLSRSQLTEKDRKLLHRWAWSISWSGRTGARLRKALRVAFVLLPIAFLVGCPPEGPAPIVPVSPVKIMGAWPIDNGHVKRLHDDETGVTCWLYRETSWVEGGYALGIGLSCVADWTLSKPPAAEKP